MSARRRARHWCGWQAPPDGDDLEALGWHRVDCASRGWTAREITGPLPPVRSRPKLGPVHHRGAA